ncbi:MULTISPECIES: site-specific integrase [Protofrankia]|uniref:Integrase family protein n=1 Tax=Candidatus Protofrankia datiscae TaxID=2716812 RepID=F8AX93_9ACTN|nr:MULTISPECIES: site-specific integrase [Protofrankia]AEH08444.1 integrase family protein [Candidatus Protofrankia datiscae]
MTAEPGRRGRLAVPGITVYQRGKTWSYRVDLDPHPLTGKRQRENRGGFATDDEAWSEALKARGELEAGRHVKRSRRKVRQFVAEWLAAIEPAVKRSTYVNYVDYLDAYVLPVLGDRRLQDITVTVLNTFSRHLLENGRRKTNTNLTMYAYWARQTRADRPVTAAELAEVGKTTIHAGRAALGRYRRGRVPRDIGTGLAPKTVRNVLNMLHKAFGDAVVWRYIEINPAEHVVKPRVGRHRPTTWDAVQLGTWVRAADVDRFRALWMLAATTGMRRSELAGIDRDGLDLDAATLVIADTRVVVGGKAIDEDGKSDSGRRMIALDAPTVAILREHLTMLDRERESWSGDYPDHGKLFVYEDGRPIHPDTITRRFNRLVDRAGLPRIRLHDVRHSYATVSIDAGANPKVVSERIGHASLAFTLATYVQRTGDLTREATTATTVTNLILGREETKDSDVTDDTKEPEEED